MTDRLTIMLEKNLNTTDQDLALEATKQRRREYVYAAFIFLLVIIVLFSPVLVWLKEMFHKITAPIRHQTIKFERNGTQETKPLNRPNDPGNTVVNVDNGQ